MAASVARLLEYWSGMLMLTAYLTVQAAGGIILCCPNEIRFSCMVVCGSSGRGSCQLCLASFLPHAFLNRRHQNALMSSLKLSRISFMRHGMVHIHVCTETWLVLSLSSCPCAQANDISTAQGVPMGYIALCRRLVPSNVSP